VKGREVGRTAVLMNNPTMFATAQDLSLLSSMTTRTHGYKSISIDTNQHLDHYGRPGSGKQGAVHWQSLILRPHAKFASTFLEDHATRRPK
jgi:hypothetical protein